MKTLRRGTGRAKNRKCSPAHADPALADFRTALRELLRLHYRYRFDPLGLTAEERAELRQAARSCLADLGALA